jgi:hypothetical protein
MSWLFSQALAEEYSVGTSLAGEQFAQLNVMPTPHKFWRNDKTMEFSSLSRFGLTLRLLTESHGEELLMSFLEDSRARTLAQQEQELGSKASVPGFGQRWRGSFATYSPDLSLWKTAQCSLLADWEEFSETWPRWGSMRNGESYLRPIPEHLTLEKESGLWATPTVAVGGCPDGEWTGTYFKKKNGKKAQTRLTDQVAMTPARWPTPCARDYRSGMAKETLLRRQQESKRGVNLSEFMQRVSGTNGQLNPTWVEWLMGWTSEWTDLKPLAMDKFQEWQQQHSLFFVNVQVGKEAA